MAPNQILAILGPVYPLLFLICIKYLVTNIRCMIKLFADNSSLYVVVDNADSSACLLNADLEQIELHKWSKQRLLSLTSPKRNV